MPSFTPRRWMHTIALLLAIAGLGPLGSASAQTAGLTDIQRGQREFLLCKACHAVAAGAPNKVGPNLHGVFGRKVASAPGFVYSAALKAGEWVWTDEMLDRWLTKPSAVAPGTTMAFAGLAKPEDRQALIAYLKTVAE
jgi:cytochrome c